MVKQRRHRKTNQVEPFDRMLRRFKKACDRQYFEKPASIRNQKNQAIKRKRKLEAKKAAIKGYRRK